MQPSAKQGRLEWTTISSLRVFIAMQVTPFVVLIKPMRVAGFGATKVLYKVVAVYRGEHWGQSGFVNLARLYIATHTRGPLYRTFEDIRIF